ncbi:MAG: hypothetical protein WCH43_04890, partial [Verrucomicrobiota bacterium]
LRQRTGVRGKLRQDEAAGIHPTQGRLRIQMRHIAFPCQHAHDEHSTTTGASLNRTPVQKYTKIFIDKTLNRFSVLSSWAKSPRHHQTKIHP